MAELRWPHHDIAQLAALIRKGEVSIAEVVEAHAQRIEALEPLLHACTATLTAQALAGAHDLDRRGRGSADSELFGMPIALKDNQETAGIATTAGSPALRGNVPTADAAVVRRLREAGAVFMAKTNLDELALGAESINGDGVGTLNPWDGQSTAGGSSGGSAAAVAAGMCAAATGSDTGGSIRNPSAWCGVAGFKPTFGAIDADGVVPLAWSLDTVGFLAHTVDDLAFLYAETATPAALSGFVARHHVVEDVRRDRRERPQLGVVSELFEATEPSPRSALETALAALDGSAAIREVVLPWLDSAPVVLATILLAEASAAWAGDHNHWDRLGPVRALLDLGRLITAEEYLTAQRVREQMRNDLVGVLESVDALLMPAMGLDPTPDAFADSSPGPDHPVWDMAVRFTAVWNLVGAPVVSLPCAFTDRGRPVAMQVVTVPGRDLEALRVARWLQNAWQIPWSRLESEWVRAHSADPDQIHKEKGPR